MHGRRGIFFILIECVLERSWTETHQGKEEEEEVEEEVEEGG